MAEEFVATTFPSLFDRFGPDLSDDAVLVGPSTNALRGFLRWGVADATPAGEVRLLAGEHTLKTTLRSFPAASLAADMVEAGHLDIRYVTDPPTSSVVVDGGSLYVVIEADGRVGALGTENQPFVSEVYATCTDRFVDADGFVLHTPARSRILSSLANRLGSDRRDTFERGLTAMDADPDPVDEVVLSLLVAARHRDLLYEVSKWGEDVGLASKATFSRKKSDLTDAGIIDTESEPIDVGRPRLRLHLADPALEELSPAALIEHTATALASAD